MAKFTQIQQEQIDLMKAIALEVSQNEPAILKGGTSLLLTRGLNRFSEDMDFDLPQGTIFDLKKHIVKGAELVGITIDSINIKKDTEITKRYMVHYQSAFSEQCFLKIECSMRNEIRKEDVETIQGMNVYSVERMAELKTEAFINRHKARDTYDIAFLTENYPSEINLETWERIQEHVESQSIEWLSDSFDEQRDRLLSDFDGTELALKIQENIERHQSEFSSTQERTETTIHTAADILSEGNRVSITLPTQAQIRGEITQIKGNRMTLQTGRNTQVIDKDTVIRENWPVKLEPPLRREETLEYAREKAKELMGPDTTAEGAKNCKTYEGKIVGTTDMYAIQSISKSLATLHRIEDLNTARGGVPIQVGENLIIARDAMGHVTITSYNKQQKEKELERKRTLQRGSQQIGGRSR